VKLRTGSKRQESAVHPALLTALAALLLLTGFMLPTALLLLTRLLLPAALLLLARLLLPAATLLLPVALRVGLVRVLIGHVSISRERRSPRRQVEALARGSSTFVEEIRPRMRKIRLNRAQRPPESVHTGL
jgi:hypothetical protein